MGEEFNIGPRLDEMVRRIVDSYKGDARTQHIDRRYLPSRAEIIRLVNDLLELLYPGFVGRQHLTEHNVAFHVGDLLPRVGEATFRQIFMCLCYIDEMQDPREINERACDKAARDLSFAFLDSIPEVRELLAGDVQAAYDGDPAAMNLDEILLAYPGLLAISVHRLAHSLYRLQVPLMPRIMSEWAHTQTGIDIHPGARIGRNFFIDHGSGVVIGETCEIGKRVRIYQGVTLGALSVQRDEVESLRNRKRHPTIEDDVIIYSGATLLGGKTVIGARSVIGGNVWLTESVPPDTQVYLKKPELVFKEKSSQRTKRA